MRPRFLLLAFAGTLAIAPSSRAQDRGGFTSILTLGYGLQTNSVVEVPEEGDILRTSGGGTYSSWGGLNAGLGVFVSKSTALMFRISGTSFTANYINQRHVEAVIPPQGSDETVRIPNEQVVTIGE